LSASAAPKCALIESVFFRLFTQLGGPGDDNYSEKGRGKSGRKMRLLTERDNQRAAGKRTARRLFLGTFYYSTQPIIKPLTLTPPISKITHSNSMFTDKQGQLSPQSNTPIIECLIEGSVRRSFVNSAIYPSVSKKLTVFALSTQLFRLSADNYIGSISLCRRGGITKIGDYYSGRVL
jgi:hypothetical protein